MARVSAFREQVNVFTAKLSGPARQQAMVDAATAARDKALEQDEAILGHKPEFVTIVDGRTGADERTVKPGGTIAYIFGVGVALLERAVDETFAELLELSPIKTGDYRSHHLMLLNGVELDDAKTGAELNLTETDTVSFVNLMPYARKIERGYSSQAPNGVYESAGSIMRAKFGNLLNIHFSYDRYPGFSVGLKTHNVGGKAKNGKRHHKLTEARSEQYPTLILSLK